MQAGVDRWRRTQKQIIPFHREKQYSIYFMPYQGQAPGGVARYRTEAQNLETDKEYAANGTTTIANLKVS